MDHSLDLEGKSENAMEVLANEDNGNVLEDPNDKLLSCASNYEDNTFDMEALLGEQSTAPDRSEDMEINITECTDSSNLGLVEADNQDATENSSSFGDTASGLDSSTLSDAEVESRFCGGNPSALIFDGCGDAFRMRKKKLTAHWRRFIHPLMWRCKWLELQIKEFQSLALKYDRELADYDQRKHIQLENFTFEGFGVKSLPFTSRIHRKKVMKRKKRKRVEHAIDIASYMSHHNLFSYYENKRLVAAGACIDDDYGNPVIPADKTVNGNDGFGFNDEWSSLEFRDGDNSLEQILRKIYVVRTQVHKLRTRVDKVVSENPRKFASVNKLSSLVPCDALTSSAQNPVSPPCNGDIMPIRAPCTASHLLSEYNMADLVKSESAISSHGEVTPLPDMIESTDQPQVGGSYKNTGDGILIHDQAAEEGLHNSEEVRIHPVEKPRVPREEQESTIPPVLVPEADLPVKTCAPHVQSTVKSLSTSKPNASKNKRKRGRRKAGSGRWSRRSSG
ncbi:hypothetical protein L1049_018748 [Liquidambar formosana]|uniref:Uncharacterized protein n=1 Tax=Liquidambar formosana TaxID=63359 RepID=A0AAP0RAH7_LIQFO